ncbi:hypothetical protein FRB95_007982 [Tulasnella sp. JGI-2019a]|nr:hypothetical protein FRB95_007982 [Tulasnella sp. JGI-2019a]
MMITRDVVALYGLIKGHRWCALSIFNPDFLSPFEIIFRHILDNPQMCRISSFRMESSSPYFERNVEVARTLAREALQQDLGITRLAIPMNLLDPSHPLLQAVSYLQLLGGWSQRDVLSSIREASSLRSLRVDSILRGSEDESTPVTTLLELEHLDLRNHQKFPKLLMQKLDLPNIHTLKLSSIQCSSIKQGDEQLRSLLESVPWMARVKAFSLEDVGITEEALLWMLRGLPLLEDLALSSAGRVSCKTTNALSQPPTARRGWLCPRLEVIKFGECRPLQERSVVALVRARVRDIPNTTPDGVTEPNLLPPVRLRKVVWRGRDMV